MRAILQELVYDSLHEGAVWPFDPHYIRPPHFHGQLECLLVRSGTATLRLGSRAEKVRAGQLCWVLPGVPHVMDGFSPDFDMWVIELDAAVVDSCWRAVSGSIADDDRHGVFESWSVSLGDRLAGRTTVELSPADARNLDALASQVWHAVVPADAGALLRALCTLALRLTLPNVERRREPSLAQLASCLLLGTPTMDRRAAAAELGVSEGFLSRSVHRELGVTFVEQRARTRVAHFLALMQGGRRNLLRAALDAGFGSYSQFHRIFTRVSGSRPRDYLAGGRHRLQLLVAGDIHDPRSAPALALPDREWQRAPMDA